MKLNQDLSHIARYAIYTVMLENSHIHVAIHLYGLEFLVIVIP